MEQLHLNPPNEEFLQWYNKERKRNQYLSLQTKLGLSVILFLALFRPILILIMEFEITLITRIFYLLMYGLPGIWIVGYVIWEMTKFSRQTKSGKLRSVALNKIPALDEICENLRSRMGISDNKKMNFWLSNSKTFLPSIEGRGRNIHLILPMNFILLLKKNKPMAEAITAHELAHILHKDVNLWHISFVFAKAIKKIFLPVSLLIAGIQIMNTCIILYVEGYHKTLLIMPQVDLLLITAIYITVAQSRQGRQLSELLADVAAIIHANGIKLQEAINQFISGTYPDTEIHPWKYHRIDAINEKLAFLNLNDNQTKHELNQKKEILKFKILPHISDQIYRKIEAIIQENDMRHKLKGTFSGITWNGSISRSVYGINRTTKNIGILFSLVFPAAIALSAPNLFFRSSIYLIFATSVLFHSLIGIIPSNRVDIDLKKGIISKRFMKITFYQKKLDQLEGFDIQRSSFPQLLGWWIYAKYPNNQRLRLGIIFNERDAVKMRKALFDILSITNDKKLN